MESVEVRVVIEWVREGLEVGGVVSEMWKFFELDGFE